MCKCTKDLYGLKQYGPIVHVYHCFCFMLGSSCISWLSKKQSHVATSNCEAKYKGFFRAMVECVWLRCLMDYLGIGQDTTDINYIDHHSTLVVARNLIFHARRKHIE
ncbi:hypothetical protein GOP47_0026046, partial [Adiantum capillus-veneris]